MAAQFTVPLVHCAAWCPSLPQMLQAWMELPAGRRSLWCFSMVATVARVQVESDHATRVATRVADRPYNLSLAVLGNPPLRLTFSEKR